MGHSADFDESKKVPEPRRDPLAKPLSEAEFFKRFKQRFSDPIYEEHRSNIDKLANLAWQAHEENHKWPITRKAGPGFKDPEFELGVEWYAAHEEIKKAQSLYEDPKAPLRILLISAADRNDQSCPSEVSKTKRLTEMALKKIKNRPNVEVELLDLSQMISEYGKHIYPCKACVSTSMALCHWPCSCYPNFAVDQMHDWMNDIYPMWVKAHGIFIITPVYWYQAPSALKLMMDRLVCADGGNPDPTSTQGKNAKKAKEIELNGWNYPRHLAGRLFSVFVHGDAEGADFLKAALNNWLSDMHLIRAHDQAAQARYIGYMGTYAESHEHLEKDKNVQTEVEELAEALVESVRAQRRGEMRGAKSDFEESRPK